MNLNNINFSESDIVQLDGEWAIFWNEFVDPNRVPEATEFITVPGSWTNDGRFPSWGFATLNLKINGLEKGRIYSFYIPEMSSSYQLYLNGMLYGRNGVIGQNAIGSRPQFLPRSTTFEAKADSINLTIHISNYSYRIGGIWRNILLGSDSSIRTYRNKRIIIEVLLLGMLLSIAFFHIGIYFFRRKEKAELFFGGICLTLAIRVITTGEQLLTTLYPDLSWEIIRKLEYIPFYGSIPLFLLLLKILFPTEIIVFVHKVLNIYSAVLGLLVFILPIKISNYIIPSAITVTLILFMYVVIIMFKIIKNRRPYSKLFTISYSLFFVAAIHDSIFTLMGIGINYLSPIGFIFSIIGQSLILIKKFINSIYKNEILEESRDKFRQESFTDALTGLYNSRYLYLNLSKELEEHLQHDFQLSYLMLDVDNFKCFNDTYGHTYGDKVLKKMAETIKRSARECDIVCRYGGEEFAIILPRTSESVAKEIAERIRKNVKENRNDEELEASVTISIGLSSSRVDDKPRTLIERADSALYIAKKMGKNRVEASI